MTAEFFWLTALKLRAPQQNEVHQLCVIQMTAGTGWAIYFHMNIYFFKFLLSSSFSKQNHDVTALWCQNIFFQGC